MATLPCKVVVTPDLPIVKALALAEPKLIVPVVPVAVPVSTLMLPELLVDPVALPVVIDTPSELVDAVLVDELATFAALKA
jgi:hypothetical protein